jgi:neurofibromin 1
MSVEAGGPVGSLVERLTSRLPHRTGIDSRDLLADDIANITRTTLLNISVTSIAPVVEHLWSLLEELARPYKTYATHPSHVLASEVYILSLVADCCRAHWSALSKANHANGNDRASPNGGLSSSDLGTPASLNTSLVTRVFDYLKLMMDPIPADYVVSAKFLLDVESARTMFDPRQGAGWDTAVDAVHLENGTDGLQLGPLKDIELSARAITEFVTASSWNASFDYLRAVIYKARKTAPPQVGMVPTLAMAEDERDQLAILRLFAAMWMDSHKLALVLQEFCSSFLHFRRAFQVTTAAVTPGLITRWIERFPNEFVSLHLRSKKLDATTDTLFDMTQTIVDNGRRQPWLFPLQMCLLGLAPDVFEVASNLRDAKSGSLAKRVAFLESMRGALRNRSDLACICLCGLLRSARFFDVNGDAAIASYAMDIQNEVSDVIFRPAYSGSDGVVFDQELMSVAFVCLVELNVEHHAESLAQACLQPAAPQTFKLALIQACTHFAMQPEPQRYRRLFTLSARFIQDQFKTMSAVFADMYLGDDSSQPKPSDASISTSSVMLCNILKFLSASPTTLFENPPDGEMARAHFYEENFAAFASCLVTAEDTVRSLAAPLAEKLLAPDGVVEALRKSKAIDLQAFSVNFWRLT